MFKIRSHQNDLANLVLEFRDSSLFIEEGKIQLSFIMHPCERRRAAIFLARVETAPQCVTHGDCQLSQNPLMNSLRLHFEPDEDTFNFFIDGPRARVIINIPLSRRKELVKFFDDGAKNEVL